MKKNILILLLIFSLFSCKEEIRFDGTSKETFDQSMTEIKKELTGLEIDKLGEAIAIFIKYKTTGVTDEAKWFQVRELMNKKTIDEVFDLAEQIAKENNFAWMRNSAPNSELTLPTVIDTVQIDDKDKPDYKQLEYATNLKIQVIPNIPDSLGRVNEMYIYPQLIDETGSQISFSNLPLKALITIKNNGNVIHTLNADFENSYIGEPAKRRGIRFPYKYLNAEKMIDDFVDIECKVNTPNGYFSANRKNFKVQLNSNDFVSNSKEVNPQKAEELTNFIKTFINRIGKKELEQAFQQTKNPKWSSFETFSDASSGYGSVTSTEIYTTEVKKIDQNKAILVSDFVIAKEGKKILLTQTFSLEFMEGEWKIVNSKVDAAKEQK